MEFIITQLNDNRDDLSAMPKVLSVLICAFNQGDGVGGGGGWEIQVIMCQRKNFFPIRTVKY